MLEEDELDVPPAWRAACASRGREAGDGRGEEGKRSRAQLALDGGRADDGSARDDRPKQTLATAHRMMREHGVRHLPVLEHGELVGIVTQRDLYFLETLRGVDLDDDRVEDAMTTDTYFVTPEAPIGVVASEMALRGYGCAVVIERGKVAGIFTATDALRLLGRLTPGARVAVDVAGDARPSRGSASAASR